MLLVDDHLARVALSAAAPLQWQRRVPSVTWVFYMRLAAAIDSTGEMHVAERNFTDAWSECLRGSGVSVTTYSPDELRSARPS